MLRTFLAVLLNFLLLSGSTPSLMQKTFVNTSSQRKQKQQVVSGDVRLMTLDPGHFHAALVQKVRYPGVSPIVAVYAPAGSDLDEHLKRIEGYNQRTQNRTDWEEKVYAGPDFLERMLAEKPGNVVVISGNNRKKVDYISASLDAGLNVLADKPMCLDTDGFARLKLAFKTAEQRGVLLYDIMTERYEITTMLEKALVNDPAVFGKLQTGTPDDPAVVKESVHNIFKSVSGKPLQRPPWFFDVAQQGEGIVDVTTHLIDLVQWESFPEQVLSPSDVEMLRARRWPTVLTPDQFQKVTSLSGFPDYLKDRLNVDGALPYYSNGEMVYRLKSIHARVGVIWNFGAPAGPGDTHYSVMRGTRASVIIRQGQEENYRPELYVQAAGSNSGTSLQAPLKKALEKLKMTFPGLEMEWKNDRWHISIPDEFRKDHEAHFGQVMESFMQYLRVGRLPAWEVAGMITKYYTTTKALALAVAAESSPQRK